VKVAVVMPGHIGTDIVTNSRRFLGAPEPDDMTSEDLVEVRRTMAQRGLMVEGVADEDLRKGVAMMAEMFKTAAPLTGASGRATTAMAPAETAAQSIPAPEEVLGFKPGDDRKLASWDQVVEYFDRLDRASDRIKFETLGKSTMDRPFVMAKKSSSATSKSNFIPRATCWARRRSR